MLKNILNLNGAQELSKSEQTSINGGGSSRCVYNATCAGQPGTDGFCCTDHLGQRRTCINSCCYGPTVPPKSCP